MLSTQGLAQPGSTPGPAFKYYVWGQVRSPGAYSLSINPDIMELLSAAGGPTEYADVRHVVLIQAVTHRRIRVDLKRMFNTGQVIPLSPGDIVLVPTSLWYPIRDFLSVSTTIISLATFVLAFTNWRRS